MNPIVDIKVRKLTPKEIEEIKRKRVINPQAKEKKEENVPQTA